MARASSSDEVDARSCDAVNNMEPLNPSDAMMMPAVMPSPERTLILAQVRRLSLRRTARLENLDPGPGPQVELAPHRAIREPS
jgi:hypothetical protein